MWDFNKYQILYETFHNYKKRYIIYQTTHYKILYGLPVLFSLYTLYIIVQWVQSL